MSLKQKPMFDQMSDEIADACTAIVERYKPQIKKRKVSPNIVSFWIAEGARRTRGVYKNRVPPSSGWPNGFTPSVSSTGGCDLHSKAPVVHPIMKKTFCEACGEEINLDADAVEIQDGKFFHEACWKDSEAQQ
jgi:hypothetical protein